MTIKHKFKSKKTLLAASLILLLTACGGSDGSSGSELGTALSDKAAKAAKTDFEGSWSEIDEDKCTYTLKITGLRAVGHQACKEDDKNTYEMDHVSILSIGNKHDGVVEVDRTLVAFKMSGLDNGKQRTVTGDDWYDEDEQSLGKWINGKKQEGFFRLVDANTLTIVFDEPREDGDAKDSKRPQVSEILNHPDETFKRQK